MRWKKGKIVSVLFRDHVEDASEPMDFVLYGRVGKVGRDYICIDSWGHADPDKGHDSNVKRFTILKKVIIEAKELS
tara:strand:+ start:116 stop:343 length:228 start_codon:yes stop_codon:yes gene_type:complete